ncbi:MAG TPA: hypothetical protein VLB12_15010 [Gemmatimonadales bacterium]|nr:hypothetical protein [Gemmatimonadales bacterium]
MAQRDVVLRWIQQAARVIARLLRRGKPGDLELARIELESAEEALLGPLARLIPALEPRSAAGLLGDPEKILGYARLLILRSALRRAQGEEEAAALDQSRGGEFQDLALASRPDLASLWRDESDDASEKPS